MTAVGAAEHQHRLPRRDHLAFLGEAAQHAPVLRRDDGGVAEVEAGRVTRGARDRRLRAQVLQRLEADHLVGMQPLAALEVALRLERALAGLLELRVDLGQFDLGQQLSLAHDGAFAHGDATDDAAGLEGQAHLVLVRDEPARADRDIGGARGSRRGAHRRPLGRSLGGLRGLRAASRHRGERQGEHDQDGDSGHGRFARLTATALRWRNRGRLGARAAGSAPRSGSVRRR